MVFNPYDNEDSSDDPKKAKLRNQAQQDYIAQLQQRIANQSNKIEELQIEISKLNEIISAKAQEAENYSLRIQEEREFFEQDKKARSEREYDLTKQLQQKDIELKKAQEEPGTSYPPTPAFSQTEETPPVQEAKTSQLDNYVDSLMAYYKKPTNEVFVNSLRDMIIYSSTKGTIDQQILGLLLKAEKPLTEEELKQRIGVDPQQVTRAIFRLQQKVHIKKVGRGFTVISSEFAEMTDISTNWGGLTVERIYENLLSVVYVESNPAELMDAIIKARDALMEMGALSTSKRHEISQIIEKLKRHPITSEELTSKIQEWKEA
ncbi:MAG: GntR family transcriptional regulator [Candidatus Heimdallarchaeota archaeon]|nr:GntR family transcriptional regulator [Candidatus Heimdallarchaeota archaeon]